MSGGYLNLNKCLIDFFTKQNPLHTVESNAMGLVLPPDSTSSILNNDKKYNQQ